MKGSAKNTPSLHSTPSSSSLGTTNTAKPDQPGINNAPPNGQTKQGEAGQASKPQTPQRYVYYERTGVPNPDAQPKPKSKLSRFLSRFQSPAVKSTLAARERQKLEEERRGVKIYTPLGAPSGGKAWAAEALG
ncbi:hypothetical protein MFIFM68171_09739 [Madurella fahalii]|uniref:Uncharacterized protein n=1 Tax=Madurella fahalii TaxID=1157608 RepID=A0ABQ0GP66_9PEZI